MKVMVVDDSRMIQALVRESLESRGIEVLSAGDGLAAKESLEGNGDVDLILLDWNMPVMNGEQFLVALAQERFSEARIVILSTDHSSVDMQTAFTKKCIGYIMKPFTYEELFKEIELLTGVSFSV